MIDHKTLNALTYFELQLLCRKYIYDHGLLYRLWANITEFKLAGCCIHYKWNEDYKHACNTKYQ